ncbi:MAG TPA: MBL fold metallo-hydrolase [Candidatus Dormibacteraeota bacterium]
MVAYPVRFDRGVHLPECGVWLDPLRRQDLAVVSHAHGDHIARHRAVVCTAPTYRLLTHRVGAGVEPHLLDYGEELAMGDALVSLHPAGHVLGSSQVLVRHRGVRILYSGDIRCRAGFTAEPLEHVACDLLVVEATFGHPHYRFPPAPQVVAEVVAFCRKALAEGCTPILLAYSLGKAQEVLASLRGSGLRVLLHDRVHALVEIYRDLGIDLPPAERLTAASNLAGTVVVVPPHLRGLRALERMGPRRTALLSGWAVDGAATLLRLDCDAAFPLSDHGDFDELLAFVERSGARRVLTVHGFAAELAAQLRRRGVDASPLRSNEQLALALA